MRFGRFGRFEVKLFPVALKVAKVLCSSCLCFWEFFRSTVSNLRTSISPEHNCIPVFDDPVSQEIEQPAIFQVFVSFTAPSALSGSWMFALLLDRAWQHFKSSTRPTLTCSQLELLVTAHSFPRRSSFLAVQRNPGTSCADRLGTVRGRYKTLQHRIVADLVPRTPLSSWCPGLDIIFGYLLRKIPPIYR